MTSKTPVLRRNLLSAAILMAAVAPAALAAPQQSNAPRELGRITVLGQALEGAPATSLKPSGPIQIISQKQIEESGLTSIGNILARLTIFGSGTSTTNNFGANGETCINLRNLGCNRVLVLVNGRRWPHLITGEVDMNTIPLAIVDHVEILKAGASAEYGSGAMAGVVNIVTKANFKGTRISGYFGQYMDGGEHDGQTQMYSITHGVTSDKGSSVFSLSFTRQRPILGGARALTAIPSPGTGITRGSSTVTQGRYVFINPITHEKQDLTIIDGTPGTSPSDYRPFDPTKDFYNFAPANYLLTPSKRVGLYAHGQYRFSDSISGHYTALYNDRRSSQQGGPAEPKGGTQGVIAYNIPANQKYNPFGFDLNAIGPNPNLLLLAYQPIETGLRHWHEDSQTFYVGGGLEGKFALGSHPFDWAVNLTYNRNTMDTTDGPEVNLKRWQNALSGPSVCGPGSPNPDCVPLNLFGGQYNGGGITPEMWEYVSYTASSYIETSERAYTANISTPLVQLPAGPLKATLGYEYLYTHGSFRPDALAASGQSTLGVTPGANSGPPIDGAYHMNAESLAFNIPLLADVAGAKLLRLDLATRHSDYNSFGGIDSHLAVLNWIVNDQLAFRASWSRDFNAPNVSQLYSASMAGAAAVGDPCSNYTAAGTDPVIAASCAAAGVPASYVQLTNTIPTTSGRNPNLAPETSTSRTLAVSWQPVATLPLVFNADYFNIEIRDAIGSIAPRDLLDGCYIAGASNFCSLITRNASGAITNINAGNVNLGSLRTAGVDFDVNYALATGSFGNFAFDWRNTWVKQFTETNPNFSNPSQPIVNHLAGLETGRGGGYPEYKSSFTTNWTYAQWQVMWQIRYFSDMTEHCSDRYDGTPLSYTNLGLCSNPNFDNNRLSTNRVATAVFHNVQAKYQFADDATQLIFGINNVFNRHPPVSYSARGYDKAIYPIPGRFPYISISHTFGLP